MIVRFGSAMALAVLLLSIVAGTTAAVSAANPTASTAAPARASDGEQAGVSEAANSTAPVFSASATATTDSVTAGSATTSSTTRGSATASPANAGAATANVATAPIAASPVNLASGLIFLLVMLLVAAWLVKRSGGMPSWRGGGAIKVVAALSVGPRERVLLVEVGGQQWLLGVTPSAINNLHHFAEPIVAAGNAEEFSNKLRQLLPQGFGK